MQKIDMRVILYLFLTLVATSCLTKKSKDCSVQLKIIKSIQEHYVATTTAAVLAPIEVISDDANIFEKSCVVNYNSDINSEIVNISSFDRMIRIESSKECDTLINILIAYNFQGKVVMYTSKYNAITKVLDSIYFQNVIYN